MPRIVIYVNGSKYQLWCNIGWFRGETPRLIQVTLFDFNEYSIDIFELQIVKFLFGFGLHKED